MHGIRVSLLPLRAQQWPELRRAGGYAKETTPFGEFLWADFLRRRIARAMVEEDFSNTLEQALAAAKSADADYLPGWCGPSSEP